MEIPRAEKKMDEVYRKNLAGCPMFHKRVLVGEPADKILETAEKEDVDVVVMATHGRKGRHEFGSVTERVLKRSPIPVWTMRPFKRKKAA